MKTKFSAGCAYCGHTVPLYVKDGKLFIAGHSYSSREYTVQRQLMQQIGGSTLSVERRVPRTVTRHCEGGSLRIVGYVHESKRHEPDRKVEPAPQKDGNILEVVREGDTVFIIYR